MLARRGWRSARLSETGGRAPAAAASFVLSSESLRESSRKWRCPRSEPLPSAAAAGVVGKFGGGARGAGEAVPRSNRWSRKRTLELPVMAVRTISPKERLRRWLLLEPSTASPPSSYLAGVAAAVTSSVGNSSEICAIDSTTGAPLRTTSPSVAMPSVSFLSVGSRGGSRCGSGGGVDSPAAAAVPSPAPRRGETRLRPPPVSIDDPPAAVLSSGILRCSRRDPRPPPPPPDPPGGLPNKRVLPPPDDDDDDDGEGGAGRVGNKTSSSFHGKNTTNSTTPGTTKLLRTWCAWSIP